MTKCIQQSTVNREIKRAMRSIQTANEGKARYHCWVITLTGGTYNVLEVCYHDMNGILSTYKIAM